MAPGTGSGPTRRRGTSGTRRWPRSTGARAGRDPAPSSRTIPTPPVEAAGEPGRTVREDFEGGADTGDDGDAESPAVEAGPEFLLRRSQRDPEDVGPRGIDPFDQLGAFLPRGAPERRGNEAGGLEARIAARERAAQLAEGVLRGSEKEMAGFRQALHQEGGQIGAMDAGRCLEARGAQEPSD